MAVDQATVPEGEKPATAAIPASEQPTGEVKTSTPPLAEGAPSKLPHAWMEGLTAEQKADAELVKALSKFEKGIPDFAKAYPELEKKLGQALVIPNEKSTPEEVAAFRKKMGVPDKPEDYKLDKVELPEGVKLDEERTKAILAVMHANGVPQKAVNETVKAYLTAFGKDVAAAMKFVKITKEEATAKLRGELGAKYDTAIALMDRAIAAVGKKDPAEMEAFRAMTKSTGLDLHPIMIRIFSTVGEMIGEHAFVDSASGRPESSGVPFGQRSDAELANTLWNKPA